MAILPSLREANQKFIFQTGFHGVFLVTPPSTPITPPWQELERIVNALYRDHPGVEEVAEYIGISPAQMMAFKVNPPAYNCTLPKTKLYKRFYSAIILYRLIHEQPLHYVSQLMYIERGQTQTLQKDSSIFCSLIVIFCKRLHWNLLSGAIESLSSRLSRGVSDDVLPLARLGSELSAIRCR